MTAMTLDQIAKALVVDGKGILAADESSPTIKKRFDSIKIESTEENRRDYREMLFRAPDAGNYISGVILFDETIRQSASPTAQALVKPSGGRRHHSRHQGRHGGQAPGRPSRTRRSPKGSDGLRDQAGRTTAKLGARASPSGARVYRTDIGEEHAQRRLASPPTPMPWPATPPWRRKPALCRSSSPRC